MPSRIQRSRAKGWRAPAGAVYVGRPGLLGNPFPVDVYGRDEAVDLYRRWLTQNMSTYEMSGLCRCDQWAARDISLVALRRWVLDEMPKIRGKDLICWCPLDSACHADVLLELVCEAVPAA